MSPTESASTRGQRLRAGVLPAPGPLRTLTKATLANTVGNGLYYTVEVLFFARSVGIPVHRVALGLGVAAVFGLLVSIPVGHLSDRWDPRFVVAAGTVGQGVVMATFVLAHSFLPFLLLNVVSGALQGPTGAGRSVVIGRMGEGEGRVQVLAYQRAVTNLGMSVGIALSGVGLAIDTRAAYVTMVLANAVTFFVAAGFVLRLPALPARPVEPGGRRAPMTVVLRDRRYLSAAVLNGLFSVHFVIQSVALPLWVVEDTRAPRWWVSVLLVVNTLMVIALQVRASRGSGDVARAARVYRRAGLLVALACVLYGAAHGLDPIVASAVLVLAMVAHSLGEILSSGASWGLGYGLAREDLLGQYQGAYSLGRSLSGIVGPSLVTALAIGAGRLGWLVLAGGFAVLGTAFTPLVTGATRDRAMTPRTSSAAEAAD